MSLGFGASASASASASAGVGFGAGIGAGIGAETVESPFTAFNFEVVLELGAPLPGVGAPVCHGAFSECEGIEVSIEPKTMTAGGVNDFQTHLTGAARYGQLTLRRGMTTSADLWAWLVAVTTPGKVVTADGEITMRDAAGVTQATFVLEGCLPVRLRGPGLNAQTGMVAVEELGLAVGRLTLGSGGDGGAFGLTASAGVSVGAGVSAGASASVGAGAQVSGGLGLSGQLGGTFSAGGSAGASAGLGAG